MQDLGLGARLGREGLVHGGINLVGDSEMFRVDLQALTGRSVTVYGQSEVMRDLNDAAVERGLKLVFEAEDVTLHEIETNRPHVTWREMGSTSGSTATS